MRMLRDMVCIDPERELKLSDLIILPDNTKAKANCAGVVRFTGPKCTFVRPGDRVWYEKFDHTVGPMESIIISESEILARRGR